MKILILAGGMCATLFFSGCAVFTFQSVETAPKGKLKLSGGGGMTVTTDSMFYPDDPMRGIAELFPQRR